jgi:hypothetical protein
VFFLPVGETRRSADFYVSADLTRPSERRLRAGKNRVFRHLTLRFPLHFWPFSCHAERHASSVSRLTPSRRAWTHVPRGRPRHAAGRTWCPVERRDTCSAMAAYWRRRSLCAAWRHDRLDPETHGPPSVPWAGLGRHALAARPDLSLHSACSANVHAR